MNVVRSITVLLAAGVLAACGDGTVRSPGAVAQLQSITVDAERPSTPLGDTLALTATGHFNPASAPQGEAETRDMTREVQWASDAPEIATVDENGVLTALRVGHVGISASYEDIGSETVTIEVTPAALRGLQIRNAAGSNVSNVSLADGESTRLFAWGRYSDDELRLLQADDVLASWSSNDSSVTTPDPDSGTAITLRGMNPGTASLSVQLSDPADGAPILGSDGATPISATVPVSVGTAQITALSHLRWAEDDAPLDTVPSTELRLDRNATRQAVAIGVFSDGSRSAVEPNLIDWDTAPADSDTASVDDEGAVSGLAVGALDLVATLKTSPGGSDGSASRALRVDDATCREPARDDRFYANGWFVPVLCLVCSANDAQNVINDDDSDFATLTNNVALLGGETAINVGLRPNADGTVDTLNTGPAPAPVKFLLAIDPGTFPALTVGLFNTTYISLHLDTDPDAAPLNDLGGIAGFDSVTNQVASSSVGESDINALELSLLGLQLVPGLETVEASYVPPANVEYNRLRLGNNAGVASVSLTNSVRVSRACVSE